MLHSIQAFLIAHAVSAGCILLGWNLMVFLLYGLDKAKAKKGAWRIPEKTLLLCAGVFGGLGAFAGMKLFRHKTKHTSFRILVPLFLGIQFALILFLTVFQ